MLGAVQMRPETHAYAGDFPQISQAEDLIAAGVGKDGPAPGHEGVQAAELANQLVAWAQIEVIGVGQDDAGAQLFERFLRQALDRRGRADGHENRGFDCAMRSREEATAPASRIALLKSERKSH